MSERDTHFRDAAWCVWEKMKQHYVLYEMLEDLSDRAGPGVDIDLTTFERDMQTLLTQWNYDFARYILESVRWTGVPRYIDDSIPDVREWPKHE